MSPQVFKITRSFDASREQVWKAWTDPRQFAQWFGPKGFTCEVKIFDLKPGGIIHSCLKSPDGAEMWAKFVYREVEAPVRLSWEHSFADKDGKLTRHPYQPQWPLKLLTTIVFEEREKKTALKLTWTPLEATEEECKIFADAIPNMDQGWGGTFGQLETFLADGKAV